MTNTARANDPIADFTDEELAALTDQEKVVGSPVFASEYKREYSTEFSSGNVEAADNYSYWTHKSRELTIEDTVPTVDFDIVHDNPFKPSIKIHNFEEGLIPYIEIDACETFDSPSLLRTPPLATAQSGHNLSSNKGSKLFIPNTTQRDFKLTNSYEFPIRLHSFFLNLDARSISFSDYAKMSELLTHGFQDQPLLRLQEVYNYALHHVLWGDDRYMKSGYELFSAGVGGCGNVNNMVGEMLEMRGIRYRMVSGFNPIVRKAYPGGGHSAIEVLIGDQWTYVDAFLDVVAHGYSADTLNQSDDYSGLHIFFIDNKTFPEDIYGKSMTLGRLFRYRMYSDLGGRSITHTMVNLGSGCDDYGRSWPLRRLDPGDKVDFAKDLLPEREVFVRARYVKSAQPIMHGGNPSFAVDSPASAWVTKSFTIKAKDFFGDLV
jgi:Transglutaminase-like superfamily